jgi:hypothetical protein
LRHSGAVNSHSIRWWRNAPAWTDAQSRDDAIVMTVTQLRRALQKYPFPVLDDEGREAPDTGSIDADAGMIVQAALDEARDRLFQSGQFGAGLAEALVEMAQASFDLVADPARRSRFRVNLLINNDKDERAMADATG